MKIDLKPKKRSLINILPGTVMLSFLASVLMPAPGQGGKLELLSLDELLDLEVVSVAKVPEKVIDTPAAIYIITGEDLRRSGVLSVPDALRMVPGLHVYQIDANKWAVSARGFASRFANKMLVMIDGRTVYSTLFSGVFWDVQDIMLEDIDRIEVIRGPGGTLWGANAVNGVINIISKDSADTQGSLVTLQAETTASGEVSTRYGGWLNDKTSYRFYGKYFNRGSFDTPSGEDAADDWHAVRGGFRMDVNVTASNKLTLQGDLYGGKSGETVATPAPLSPYVNEITTDVPVSGGNMLGRWTRTFSKNSEMILQVYYDHTDRNGFIVDETADTADFDFQHCLNMTGGLEILWGLGYRFTKGNTESLETILDLDVFTYSLDPQIREDNLFSGFLQGHLPIAGEKGEISLGTKLEHNDYTGFEWQPHARIMWNLRDNHSLWGAVSRSVRTASRMEHDADSTGVAFIIDDADFLLFPEFLTFVRLTGNEETKSEIIYSYESGYRGRLVDNIFLDLSIYYNKYENLINTVPFGIPFFEDSSAGPHLVLPYRVDNGMDGETYGAEISCGWSVTDWWRLTGGFTWFHFNILNIGNSQEPRQGFEEDENADHLFSLVSYMDLPGHFELNATLYAVDALDGIDIDSYIRFDFNVGWHPTQNMSLSAGGRNLFNDSHQEFANTMDGTLASEITQTFYTKFTMSF